MPETNFVLSRTEKKYVLNAFEFATLRFALTRRLTPDEYGSYTIGNIYFDTRDFDLISRSLEKPVYKEKLRLRWYGTPDEDGKVFLEIKKKYDGVVNKRRVSLSVREAAAFLETGELPENNGQILKEIHYFLDFYKPYTRLCLCYDREAFTSAKDPSLRVTFDKNIRSRNDNLSPLAGNGGEPLFQIPTYIMEIKTNGAMPLWLSGALSENLVYPSSFSKYGSVFTQRGLLKNAV